MAQDAQAPSFELIVVDNNSTDDTRTVVESLVARHPDFLRYVFEATQGVAYGRNAGIARAQASIVAFTDDDVRVTPNWIASIARALTDHPEVDYVGGKVLPHWPSTPPEWLTPQHWAPLALTDLGDRAFIVDRANPRCLVSASLAFRRSVFEELGGFDPSFQHRCGSVAAAEDHDLQLRLWRVERKGLYDPAVIVHADVQSERLTKAYHRLWHRDHSRIACLLYKANEIYDSQGALVTRSGDRSLVGIPLWAFRGALVTMAAFIGAKLLNRGGTALLLEGSLREQLEWMRVRRMQR